MVKSTMLSLKQTFNLSNERPGRNVNRRIDLTVKILEITKKNEFKVVDTEG